MYNTLRACVNKIYSSPCVLQHMPTIPAARSFVGQSNIDPKIHAYLRSIEDRVSKVVGAVAVIVAVAAAKPGTPLPSRTWGMAPWLSAEALSLGEGE